jgi:hypothetical protein
LLLASTALSEVLGGALSAETVNWIAVPSPFCTEEVLGTAKMVAV